jgi:hypothetical protein
MKIRSAWTSNASAYGNRLTNARRIGDAGLDKLGQAAYVVGEAAIR